MVYHVRRRDKEITDREEMKEVLRSTKYVTLALSIKNEPYLVTLSHGYDDKRNCIYFHCAKEGKKIDYIKANSKVWGQALIDHGYADGKCNHIYTSVHFSGEITLIEDLGEKLEAMKCMVRQLERNPKPVITRLKPERLRDTALGRIDIDYMSGKKPEELISQA
jgi:nitroimidazol reductase NimA-like FMN-containing flavoprotein (pyridoxamine 5'-phosphate oxidase superfamily)